MEKEVRITPPEGYVIDEENSTFECVKFKPIKDCLTYEDVARKLFLDNPTFYINIEEDIVLSETGVDSYTDSTNFTSGEQAEKLLAINKLMNVAKYLNGDWKPDWNNNTEDKWFLGIKNNEIYTESIITYNSGLVYFKTKEFGEKAIQILGKNVIHLALSTDW